MAEEEKVLTNSLPVYEWKMITDTNSDIDTASLERETIDGWKLVRYVNSRAGRSSDRYYFNRIKR